MEIAMILVWMLRVVLPIVLFWIYFKLQLPKEGEEAQGSTKHCHSRAKLLDYCAVGRGAPAPEELATIVLVDEARAPMLFTPGPARSSRGRAGGRERAPRDHGERGRGARLGDAPESEASRSLEAPAPGEDPAPPGSAPAPEEEKQQLESLLNYVAFNRKEQQRTFLVDESSVPPPPPPKRATPQPPPPVAPRKGSLAGSKEPGEPLSADAEHANKEAQMILKGAMDFKRSDVANDLYAKLTDSKVEISCTTFTLMIESCISASDLKTASDLLMRMEASGHCPEASLLDKVMALYSKHKQQGGAPLAPARAAAPARTNLSSNAEMFQPSRILSEDALLDVLGGNTAAEERARLSVDAPAFIPLSAGAALGAPPPPTSAQRTALCANADPFMPKGLVSFDADNHIWTVEDGKKDAQSKGERTGKGEQRGKGDRATGKGKAGKGEGKPGKDGDPPKSTSANLATKAKVRAEAAKARGEIKDGKASPAKKTEIKEAKTWKAKEAPASAA